MKILCGFMGQCIMAFHRQLLVAIGRSVNETSSTCQRCLLSTCHCILTQQSMPTGTLHCFLISLKHCHRPRTINLIHCIRQIIALYHSNFYFIMVLNQQATQILNLISSQFVFSNMNMGLHSRMKIGVGEDPPFLGPF